MKIAVASAVTVPTATSDPTPTTTAPETATPIAVRVMATQARIQPEQPTAASAPTPVRPNQPELTQQTSITLPVATKPGTYGGITLDEATSKKLWESSGWSVKARMGTGGKKVFVVSKNGHSFVTSDTKITEGQTKIMASAE